MTGTGDPTPFDGYALSALCCVGGILLTGCILGPRWATSAATLIRWGAPLFAALVVVAVLVVTPTTNGIVGAGRLATLLPACVAIAVLFAVWCWRVGHP